MKMSEALIREFALQHNLDARQISVLKTGAGDELYRFEIPIMYPEEKWDKCVHIMIHASDADAADKQVLSQVQQIHDDIEDIKAVITSGMYGIEI